MKKIAEHHEYTDQELEALGTYSRGRCRGFGTRGWEIRGPDLDLEFANPQPGRREDANSTFGFRQDRPTQIPSGRDLASAFLREAAPAGWTPIIVIYYIIIIIIWCDMVYWPPPAANPASRRPARREPHGAATLIGTTRPRAAGPRPGSPGYRVYYRRRRPRPT
jgi:hypothetical protein